MTRKALLLAMLLTLAACGGKHVEVKPIKVKKEMPVWRMMMYKESGSSEIRHEDEWYRYSLDLDKVVKGPYSYSNVVYGECVYDGGTYTVVDKETGAVVRQLRLEQQNCKTCHSR